MTILIKTWLEPKTNGEFVKNIVSNYVIFCFFCTKYLSKP